MSEIEFFNAPLNPVFKVVRSKAGADSGDDGTPWYFSPETTGSDARTSLAQKHHINPTNLYIGIGGQDVDVQDFYSRITSEAAGSYRYVHNDFSQNGSYVLQQERDGLRQGVANHNGSHPAYEDFLKARRADIIRRGAEVEQAGHPQKPRLGSRFLIHCWYGGGFMYPAVFSVCPIILNA